jgi:ribonucleotide reductase beta subunit family protein with ferritin-like domain
MDYKMDNNKRKMEPLLVDDNSRFTQLPYKYPDIQKMYDIQETAFWTAKEINFTADYKDWVELSDNERFFIEHILAFFAGADGIVLENLLSNFINEVKAPEARNFYALQGAMENIHSQVYSILIDTYIKDTERKKFLFNAIDNIPCIKKKAEWAMKWLDPSLPFEKRLIAFSIVEGVFFSGSFCSIFWLKSMNKMVKSLGTSNELIARDEGLHTDFAVLIYKHLENKLSQNEIEEIFREAVKIEEEFICESLPCNLIGMNQKLMKQYIRYVADRLIVQLGFNKIYNDTNPFDFMKNIGLDGKTNFFEKRVSEYTLSSNAIGSNVENWDFDCDV